MSEFRENLAWAAGLFDGEGSIGRYRYTNHGKRYSRSQMTMHMCDRDVIARFVKILDVGVLNGPYNYSTKTTKRKSAWYWSIAGFERVQAVTAMMWPWLGKRRKAKAKQVLAADRKTQPRARRTRNQEGQFIS